MALMNVLIAVKTYPTLSEKYGELVCTAGFLEDGSWIRIYPVPFRQLKQKNQYNKWQWITIDLVRNDKKDFRVESYRPVNIENDIIRGDFIDTKNNWAKRKKYVLNNVYDNLDVLIAKAKQTHISLAVVKPKEVIDFVYEKGEREWDREKLKKIYARHLQGNLFKDDNETFFKVVKKVPYKFSYVFTTLDGKKHKIMIEDWELGVLYWKCLKAANGDEQIACKKVKERYFDRMVKGNDFYFLMGTTMRYHNVASNPFLIIGTFYPKHEDPELTLFD